MIDRPLRQGYIPVRIDMHEHDTIAAIATPLGEGGLAVIRVSGADAFTIVDRCFRPAGRSAPALTDAPTHTIHYGHVVDGDQTVDEVLVSVLRAPRTFTAEHTVEISCHGGLLASKAVLDRVLATGARPAEPGEFTRRAFLNGRIDLTQAEAVADLIHARTELAMTAANEQLAGRLAQRINILRDDMVRVLAHVEAHIDFPDEDISPDTRTGLLQRLREAVEFMDRLLASANEGQLLRRGVRAAIIGRPNAGKSSLLNHLLGHDRAIVSAIPGTTRDTVEETANVRGIPVVFIDTAGLRDSVDEIEVEGMRRSHAALERADLILHLIDASEPLHELDAKHLATFAKRKRVVVCNKSDLPRGMNLPDLNGTAAVTLSCTTGEGLDALRDAIKNLFWSGGMTNESLQVMINSRHQDALRRARAATDQSLRAMEADEPLDLVAMDLRIAVNAVGEIVGKTATDDILDSIFSQFCLGK